MKEEEGEGAGLSATTWPAQVSCGDRREKKEAKSRKQGGRKECFSIRDSQTLRTRVP